jgi:hypothetical protein
MSRKKILNIAERIIGAFMGLIILFVLFFTTIIIHSEFSPETYKHTTFEPKKGVKFHFGTTIPKTAETLEEFNKLETKLITLSRVDSWTKFFYFLGLIVNFGITIKILLLLIKFIHSVKDTNSFFINNSKVFRKITFYIIVGYVASIVMPLLYTAPQMHFPDGVYIHNHIHFDINFTELFQTIIFAGIAYIASEVFQEGANLKEENELTV